MVKSRASVVSIVAKQYPDQLVVALCYFIPGHIFYCFIVIAPGV